MARVVDDDIGIGRISRQKVLMIALGRIESPVRLDAGHDRRAEYMRIVELSDIGVRDLRLLGVVGKIAERYCVPASGPCRLSWVGS